MSSVEEAWGDFPYDERSQQVHAQQQLERQQQQKDLEDAWANVEHDISYAKHAMWTTEDDLKLIKWALGVK